MRAALIAVHMLALTAAASEPVTTRALLAEMTDLRRLAELPDPPFTCRQFSSYDRASVSPADPEKWFANADVGQYLRVDERDGRKEFVLMDAEGPGAIVRIWSANPKGTLRIYLDGAAEPALAGAMADLLGGRFPGLPEPLGHPASAGWNLYFPIPYARHCVVTSDEGGFYYHVNYRTYPPGTPVTTFTRAELDALAADIRAVAERLADPRSAGVAPAGAETATQITDLPPGDVLPIRLAAPGAIRGLQVQVDAGDRAAALRKLLLTIEFDGEITVACPLGDFFGAGFGPQPYAGLPLGVTADGTLWSHWIMPFRRGALVAIHNKGDAPALVNLAVAAGLYEWTPRTMYFHAGWRVSRDVPTRPFIDWNYVTLRGTGVLVGAAFTIANPYKQWWGEGDEKIYIDGEEFPSHFGTGTEDYYGYAWCCPQPFTHAYHAQPRCDGPANYGRTSVNRWHILDRIPFERSLRFDMELWHWVANGRVPEMAVVAYWYGRPGALSNHGMPIASDLAGVVLPPYVAPRVPGALEGEELKIVSQTGTAVPQELGDTSNDRQLWWRDAKPGDRLVLELPAPAPGHYRVLARFVGAPDYGVFKLMVNDVPVREPIDLFRDGVVVGPETQLGEFDLAAQNTLTVEIVGANEKARPAYMFGLDYLKLEPAQP